MKIILSGACGHMGREVARAAAEQGVTVAAGVDAAQAATDFPVYAGFDGLDGVEADGIIDFSVPAALPALAALPEKPDVVIDFSNPAVLDSLLEYCLTNGVPAVLATTGYTEADLRLVDGLAEKVPVFRSANMSVGVAVLRMLVRRAAQALEGFDIEIVEAHHRRKKDAPSGTALMLLEAARAGSAGETAPVFGREGRDCARKPGDIGVHSIRGGTVAGEHEVLFLGESERITLSHSAENRGVFANGALRAAAFLIGRAPGLYDMDDLLGC